jgi:hypothetical protein
MPAIPKVNPESIRTSNPSTWPQYPFNGTPPTPEQSEVRYSIFAEEAKRLKMRDGIDIAYDVYRPFAPEEKFPALLSWSPYTRQLQLTLAPLGQNEAGLTEFWVPRGYVQVIADVRGSATLARARLCATFRYRCGRAKLSAWSPWKGRVKSASSNCFPATVSRLRGKFWWLAVPVISARRMMLCARAWC